MLFVKFPTNDSRNKAMDVFNALRTGLGETPNFMYPDLPLNLRTESNFLRNTKNMLVDWGFEKASVQYDLDNKTLSVCGAGVLKVEVEKFVLKLKWLDTKWSSWKELQEDPKFLDLQKSLQQKLSQAMAKIDKGKGKGLMKPDAVA